MQKVWFLFSFLLIIFPTRITLADWTPILLFQKDGATNIQLGWSVASAGDVNGDGIPDVIVGAPYASPDGLLDAGSAFVYSGADGSLLYQKDGNAAGIHFGNSVSSAGDVNNDGMADFIIGAVWADPGGVFNAGSAYVYSGSDGSLLYQKDGTVEDDYLGSSVATAGDVNGDGTADFIIGASLSKAKGFIGGGAAFVYSGLDGSLLYRKDADTAWGFFGWSVSSAGDINADGKDDFLIGSPLASPNGIESGGSFFLYSGADGSLIYRKDGTVAADYLGISIASMEDINGDGRPEIIVGARRANRTGLPAAGSVFVYSGIDGSLLFQKNGEAAEDELGFSVAEAGDVDGDGKSDFIAGAWNASRNGAIGAGVIYVYSGADGTLLYRSVGIEPVEHLGTAVAGAGDLNGDGRAEFIIGAPGATAGNYFQAGSTFVYGLESCNFIKGDMNADGSWTPSDVVLVLNCIFLNSGNCDVCIADVNCDGVLTIYDAVLELNAVFLGISPLSCQ